MTLSAALSDDERRVEIDYTVEGDASDVVLNIVLVQKEAGNKVPHGENAGESLTHVQVVRNLHTIPLDEPSGKVTIEIPEGLEADDARVVAYAQDPESMRISGAGAVEL